MSKIHTAFQQKKPSYFVRDMRFEKLTHNINNIIQSPEQDKPSKTTCTSQINSTQFRPKPLEQKTFTILKRPSTLALKQTLNPPNTRQKQTLSPASPSPHPPLNKHSSTRQLLTVNGLTCVDFLNNSNTTSTIKEDSTINDDISNTINSDVYCQDKNNLDNFQKLSKSIITMLDHQVSPLNMLHYSTNPIQNRNQYKSAFANKGLSHKQTKQISVDVEIFNFFFNHLDADLRSALIKESMSKYLRSQNIHDDFPHLLIKNICKTRSHFEFHPRNCSKISEMTDTIFRIFYQTDRNILPALRWFRALLKVNIEKTNTVICNVMEYHDILKKMSVQSVQTICEREDSLNFQINQIITMFESHIMYIVSSIITNIKRYGFGDTDTIVNILQVWNEYVVIVRTFLAR